ncbi:MAG TPA: hypothetical protein VJ673_20180 [Aromatoleum sp.]|uniref:hypothetical protein n=1 Tax=Aromatoleum sp. TaxID=2307007 RepID=UPI002B494D9F|nr:hypothetical protein [Aromatoleum sp.]HJV28010.1 hypothetical protein [Aromatoleum sp.]
MMRWSAAGMVCLLSAWAPGVIAEGGKAITQFRGDVVTLYADSEGEQVVARTPRAELPTPTPIEEESGDYVRIRVSGKPYWVSALKAQINYPAARCDQHQQVASTAAARGIGEGCKTK